jgi:DNA polymerase-4
MLRNILHLDIRNFCIALERQRQPALRDWPVVIAPGRGRTVVQAVSPEAKQEGIYPGMGVARAQRRCRRLNILPPDFSFYRQVQEQVITSLGTFSPLVEPVGLGHFFIDITGTRRLWGTLLDTADRMQRLVSRDFQLHTAVGLASNKLVSRVAAKVIRIQELCDVFPGVESSFLAPLRVSLLPGVGEATTTRLLTELNLQTVGELAVVAPVLLDGVFGAAGQRLRRMAMGEDSSPVVTPRTVPTILEEIQLPKDDNRRSRLSGHLYGLVEGLGRQLRSQNRCPGELTLTVTYADGAQARTRERFSAAGSEFHLNSVLYGAALRLFDRTVQRRLRIRRLALSAAYLQSPIGQLALFPWDDSHSGKETKLLQAMDHIRDRYGNGALYYGKTTEGRRQTTEGRNKRLDVVDILRT